MGFARANAARAGVEHLIDWQVGAFAAAPLLQRRCDTALAIVTNPPFGMRTGKGDMAPLYQKLGHIVKVRFFVTDLR